MEVLRMVDSDFAARAGTSTIPFNNIETNTRVTILKHLREVEEEINKAFLVIGMKNTALYHLVKAENPDEWATFSLSDAAKLVSEYRPERWPTLVAEHKYVIRRPMESVPQFQTHRLALIYSVRPDNHLVTPQQVVDMVETRSPGLDVLIEKANESWNGPPSTVVAEHDSFTPDDRLIPDVLYLALRRMRYHYAYPYSGVVSFIIKRVGLHTQRMMDDIYLRQFLTEFGEMAPWDDMISQRRELHLDLMPGKDSQRIEDQ